MILPLSNNLKACLQGDCTKQQLRRNAAHGVVCLHSIGASNHEDNDLGHHVCTRDAQIWGNTELSNLFAKGPHYTIDVKYNAVDELCNIRDMTLTSLSCQGQQRRCALNNKH